MLSVLKTNFKIGLIFFGVCLFFPGADISMAKDRVLFKGTIASFKLNVRAKPSQNSKVIMILEQGKQVDVVNEKGGIGGWLTVVYRGKKGYIRNRPKYISLKPVEVKARVEVKAPVVIKALEPAKVKKVLASKITTQEKQVELFSQKEVEVIEGLNEIDYGLNQARLKAKNLSLETKALAVKNSKIRDARGKLLAQIDEDKIYAGQRLNALYRMRMIGRLDIAGAPSSILDFFLTQNAMKQVILSDLELLEKQARDLEKLNRLEGELAQLVAEKNDLESELNFQIRIKEKETLKKKAILSEIKRKKNLSRAALESLRASARDLDEKMKALYKKGTQSIEGSSFLRQKGRLSIPVNGKIVSRYGTSQNGNYKSFTFQSGVDIKVERGEPVRSVFKGEVMFAQWLKGYGNLVIINHGDNYYTLYAHVEEIFRKKGERVDTGEVIATAGDTGSIKGVRLHFEVRHHGKPVNPMQWIVKGV
jgi:septal ring factor EnvC (AmiA/AmiB activator)